MDKNAKNIPSITVVEGNYSTYSTERLFHMKHREAALTSYPERLSALNLIKYTDKTGVIREEILYQQIACLKSEPDYLMWMWILCCELRYLIVRKPESCQVLQLGKGKR